MIDVVADVFLVCEDLDHSGPGPGLAEIRQDLPGVELLGDYPFGLSLQEHPIHPADNLQFLFWPRDQHHAVCLQTFVFATLERAFVLTSLVDQHAAQAKAGGAALLKAELNQAARSLEDFGRQFPAVFARH